jgi:hypothetical protein
MESWVREQVSDGAIGDGAIDGGMERWVME